MAIPTAAQIINMGFSFQMFGFKTEDELTPIIDALITEHGALLSGRIGATAYASTIAPTATYVSRAVKCHVAAELCQMRINKLAQEVKQDDGKDANKMRKQRLDYLSDAELMTSKIEALAGDDDFAIGAVITSHFEDE